MKATSAKPEREREMMINRIDRVSVTHTQDTPRISVDIDHLGSRA